MTRRMGLSAKVWKMAATGLTLCSAWAAADEVDQAIQAVQAADAAAASATGAAAQPYPQIFRTYSGVSQPSAETQAAWASQLAAPVKIGEAGRISQAIQAAPAAQEALAAPAIVEGAPGLPAQAPAPASLSQAAPATPAQQAALIQQPQSGPQSGWASLGHAQSSGKFIVLQGQRARLASPDTLLNVGVGQEIQAGSQPVQFRMVSGPEIRIQKGASARLAEADLIDTVNGETIAVMSPDSPIRFGCDELLVAPSRPDQVVMVNRLSENQVRFGSINGEITIVSKSGDPIAACPPNMMMQFERSASGWSPVPFPQGAAAQQGGILQTAQIAGQSAGQISAEGQSSFQGPPPIGGPPATAVEGPEALTALGGEESAQIIQVRGLSGIPPSSIPVPPGNYRTTTMACGYDFPWPCDGPAFWGNESRNEESIPMVHLEPFSPRPTMTDPHGRSFIAAPWSALPEEADTDLAANFNNGSAVQVGITEHDAPGAPITANPIELGANDYWPNHTYVFGGMEPTGSGRQYYHHFVINRDAEPGPLAFYKNNGVEVGSVNPKRVIDGCASAVGFYVFHKSANGASIPAGTFTLRLRYDPTHNSSPLAEYDRDFVLPEIPPNRWAFLTSAVPPPNTNEAYIGKGGVPRSGIVYDRATLLLNCPIPAEVADPNNCVQIFFTGGRQMAPVAAVPIEEVAPGGTGWLIPAAVLAGGALAAVPFFIDEDDDDDDDDDDEEMTPEPASPIEPTETPTPTPTDIPTPTPTPALF